MVGTDPATQGGISTVVRGYQAAGLFESIDCRYVATHRDGSSAQKLVAAVAAVVRAALILGRHRTAVVHIHLSSRASFWRKSIFCVLAKATRTPYLLHVHGSEFMQFFEKECGSLAKRIVRLVFRHATTVLALSEQWRSNLLRIEPASRIEVLPNAVDLPDLTERNSDTGDEPVVLFLGRLGTRKGTFDLLHAFAAAASDTPRARLVCAGDGAVDEILALARNLGLSARISCPGWLDPAAAHATLKSASVFALPSYAEGLPMALLEAMSWALAVVTCPVGGIPQAIHHGDNGLLVPPGDIEALTAALKSLIQEPQLRARLGQAARRTIETTFSLPAAINHLLQIYARFGVVPVDRNQRGESPIGASR